MIDLSQMSPQEFNALLVAPIGEFIKVEFDIAAGHFCYITGIQVDNTDSVDHTFFAEYQGAGFAGNLARFDGYAFAAGTSGMIVPGDNEPTIDSNISGPWEFVGPCKLVIQGTTALVTLTSMGFKINWLEGISIAEIAGAVAPAISSAP